MLGLFDHGQPHLRTPPVTTHPAACPHCGGTDVNVAQPDYLLRPARLNEDGSLTIGDNDSASDFNGLTLLFCHGCASTYPQQAEIVERFDDTLKIDYPSPPSKTDEGYVGADVVWLPLTPADIGLLCSALDTHEYWELGERLPKNNGSVFLPDDPYGEKYWDSDEMDDDVIDAIEGVRRARTLADFLTEERRRQVAREQNFTSPED